MAEIEFERRGLPLWKVQRILILNTMLLASAATPTRSIVTTATVSKTFVLMRTSFLRAVMK